jgi:hypothetical protein
VERPGIKGKAGKAHGAINEGPERRLQPAEETSEPGVSSQEVDALGINVFIAKKRV